MTLGVSRPYSPQGRSHRKGTLLTIRFPFSSIFLLRLLLSVAVAAFVCAQVGHTVSDVAAKSHGAASAGTSGSASDHLGADASHSEDLETLVRPLQEMTPSPDRGQRTPNPIPADPTIPFLEHPEPVPISV